LEFIDDFLQFDNSIESQKRSANLNSKVIHETCKFLGKNGKRRENIEHALELNEKHIG